MHMALVLLLFELLIIGRNFIDLENFMKVKNNFFVVAIFFLASMIGMSLASQATAATAEVLDKDSQQALQALYRVNPLAEKLSRTAKATLVFPNIVKAGLVFGGSYGEGELLTGNKVTDYYNTVSASWGLPGR
jgi:lipid-binding SYLF domain-containing protein